MEVDEVGVGGMEGRREEEAIEYNFTREFVPVLLLAFLGLGFVFLK